MDQNKEWGKWLELVLGSRDRETLEMLFECFLTPKERQMLTDRFRLVKALLHDQQSQKEISENLKLSISKVTLGSKAVQALSEKARSYLMKKMKEEE